MVATWCHGYLLEIDVVLLEIQHAVGLEVLETAFRYLRKGENVVEHWSHVCSLSLGHYGTYILGFGALSQKVTNHSIK